MGFGRIQVQTVWKEDRKSSTFDTSAARVEGECVLGVEA